MRVDEDVSQQQGAEQVVAVVSDGDDGARPALLVVSAGVEDQFEVGDVERHQTEVEAGEQAGETKQTDEQHHVQRHRQQRREGTDRQVRLVAPGGCTHRRRPAGRTGRNSRRPPGSWGSTTVSRPEVPAASTDPSCRAQTDTDSVRG